MKIQLSTLFLTSQIASIGLMSAAFAETTPSPESEPRFFEGVTEELASPWSKEVRPYLLTGTGLVLGLLIFEDQIIDPTQKETAEDHPLGNFSRIGDYGGWFITNSLYSLGMLTHYWMSGSEKSYSRFEIMTKGSLYAITASSLLKVVIPEQRPNSRDRLSFPSGHSTAAFTFASGVIAEHGWGAEGVGALSLAALTAFSRMNDNQHYIHDVVAGATIGTVFGLGTAYTIQKRRARNAKEKSKATTSALELFPTYEDGTFALFATSHF